MVHLLPVIMALILGAAATVATLPLVSFSAKHGEEYKQALVNEFSSLENALIEYRRDNIGYVWVEDCPPDATTGDPSCLFDREIDPANDGLVDETTWQTDLVPQYMDTPYFKEMSSMTVNRDAGGLYLCFGVFFDDVASRAAQSLLKHYGSESFEVSNACASGSGLSDAGIEGYSGGTLYLTKWFNY